MRLTLKELELLDTTSAYNTAQHKAICGKATLELIEYKKIEEELGIDLITLFKALKNGFFKISWFQQKKYVVKEEADFVSFKKKALVKAYRNGFDEIEYAYLKLKDYGISFALTKEELQDD